MTVRSVAELPFLERPVLELLNLVEERELPDHDYAGFGWARVDSLWLAVGDAEQPIVDALVLALHSADDGEPIADDVELEFELPDGSVGVLASTFLDRWLPVLPRTKSVVLALCNAHRAELRRPAGATTPIHYGLGDVESWREGAERIILTADAWRTV
ncbi:MAG: hypothetical protein H0T46_18275 [Deltaproteobacteria bacterium]|nr:hypothetical protein [Deltaproteobacteria bacterium]